MKNYTVIAEWEESNGASDADELRVRAGCADAAIKKAKKKWKCTVGVKWPSCRIVNVFVLTPDMMREFA